jgi:hypothetical protein
MRRADRSMKKPVILAVLLAASTASANPVDFAGFMTDRSLQKVCLSSNRPRLRYLPRLHPRHCGRRHASRTASEDQRRPLRRRRWLSLVHTNRHAGEPSSHRRCKRSPRVPGSSRRRSCGVRRGNPCVHVAVPIGRRGFYKAVL